MFETISAYELKERLQKGEKFVILDVRQPEEREERRIAEDTLFIPLGELPDRMNELESYKEQELIVYCRSGGRSGRACEFLNHHGFHAVNLTGGILAW